jgi:hypothetical protein
MPAVKYTPYHRVDDALVVGGQVATGRAFYQTPFHGLAGIVSKVK